MRKKAFMRRVALLVSLLMLLTSTIQTTYGFIVVVTDPVINTFKPEDVLSGDLTITKKVVHAEGEGWLVPTDVDFTFKVELGSLYRNTHLQVSDGVTASNVQADGNGVLTVTAKAGQTIGIKGIDENRQVTITEDLTGLTGYTVQGSASKTLTISTNSDYNNVIFTNIYNPGTVPSVQVPVTVTKIMSYGPGAGTFDPAGKFEFVLQEETTGSRSALYVDDSGKAVFKLSYTEADAGKTYRYTLSETDNNIPDVEYDVEFSSQAGASLLTRTFTVEVVAPAAAGQAPTVKIDGAPAAGYAATYVNKYTGAGDVGPVVPEGSVLVSVTKNVVNTGSVELGPGGFRFLLQDITDVPSSQQNLMLSEGPVDENGDAASGTTGEQPSGQQPGETPTPGTGGENPSSTPGEQPGQQPGETPTPGTGGENPSGTPGEQPGQQPGETPTPGTGGETPSGTPGEQPSGQQPGETPSGTPGETPSGTPGEQPGQQPGETPGETPSGTPGETPAPGTGEDNSAVLGWNDSMIGGEGEGGEGGEPQILQSVPLMRDAAWSTIIPSSDTGKASYELKYTDADVGKTYKYKITEINDGESYVSYDKSEKEFTVKITRDGEGNLVTEIDGVPANTYRTSFTNTINYNPDPGPGTEPDVPEFVGVPLIALKQVIETGDVKLKKDGYEFVLTNLATGQKTIRTSSKSGQANFYLAFYEWDIGKTYTYTLTETLPEGAEGGVFENVLYDSTVHQIEVAVERDFGSMPKVNVTIDGQPHPEYFRKITFTNVEVSGVKDTVLTVKAHKTMENTGEEKMRPEEFEIVLKRVDADGKKIGSAMSDLTSKKGNASFTLPAYTVEDLGETFRYQIYEKNDEREGVTYDETVHEFQVKVVLTEDNQLKACLLLPLSIAEKYAEDMGSETISAAVKAVKDSTPEAAVESLWVDVTELGWKAEFTNIYNSEYMEEGTGEDAEGGHGAGEGMEGMGEEGANVPKTSDNSHTNFWFAMMLLSLISTIVLFVAERRSWRRYKGKHY